MSTFKAALRIVAAHPLYLGIYTVAISLMGILIVSTSFSSSPAGSAEEKYEPYPADVAIVDRDGSEVSRAFAEHMGGIYELVDVADTPSELQDAVATGRADCVFVVPAGFGRDLVDAARAGRELPAIGEAYGVSTQASALAGTEAGRWSSLAGAAAALNGEATNDEVARLANEAAAERASVQVRVPEARGGVPAEQLEVYLGFAAYSITSSVIICVGLVLAALGRQNVAARLGASPVSETRRGGEALLSCVVLTLAVCALSSCVGLIGLRDAASQIPAPQVALAFLANAALALTPLSVAFLCSQLGANEQVINAVGNILGMVMSFLGGAWIPLSFMGAGVAAAAHFAPTFWTSRAISAVLEAPALTGAVMAEYATAVGVAVLIAVAIGTCGLALGRARRR